MPTKAEQTERTRAALIAAGRALFADRGFADTSTEELVRAAGVTRGALYHHFRDKRDLFEAVYEDVEQSLVSKIASSITTATDPLDVLRQGADAFLDACLDPAVRRIALLEGPSVLGWERWREIDERYGLGLVQMTLQAAMDAGAIRPGPVEALAHVLFGGLVEAAMLLAASPTPKKARAEVGGAVRALVDGLAEPRPAGQSVGRRRAQR
jgi:AcrR family transcriptional regulator